MAEEKDDMVLAAWLDASAPILGLTIEAAYREAILANLRVIIRQAALVDGFMLDDREEPAAIFRA
jgi:hypothetical protein